jgi:hypothetical protein
MSGGFQTWSLTGLEQSLADRAADLAPSGFSLEGGDFPTTYSYGVDLQFRMTERWFLRSMFEWTRLKWSDRDRTFLAQLGAGSRTPISLSYESKVQTRPVLDTDRLGTARELSSVRLAISGNLVIAPVRLTDLVEAAIVESSTETELVSSGVGKGFAIAFSADYFTDTRSTLYVETFWRTGSTTVELEDSVWEGSTFPGRRRIDFDGVGIRLGLRWI